MTQGLGAELALIRAQPMFVEEHGGYEDIRIEDHLQGGLDLRLIAGNQFKEAFIGERTLQCYLVVFAVIFFLF
jgi:hypothetical protein